MMDFPLEKETTHDEKYLLVDGVFRRLHIPDVNFSVHSAVPYDEHFWKKVHVYKVDRVSITEIQKATYSLLKTLFIEESLTNIMCQVIHLASQLRSPEDINQLIIQNESLEAKATIHDDVRLGTVAEAEETPETFNYRGGFEFFSKFETGSVKASAHIWGPAFANLLVMCRKKSTYKVCNQITQLRQKLRHCYAGHQVDFPSFKSAESLNDFIRFSALIDARADHKAQNTVHLGLVLSYHNDTSTTKSCELIDFVCLQFLRYFGMPLVTLINQICSQFGCQPEDVARESRCSVRIAKRWDSLYHKEAGKYLSEDNDDPLWMYARSLEVKGGQAFRNLSFKYSSDLCQLLALIIDRENEVKGVKSKSKFENLRSYRGNLRYKNELHEIAYYDREGAEMIHRNLTKKFPRDNSKTNCTGDGELQKNTQFPT